MSDYVPNSTNQVRSQVDAVNNASLISSSSGSVNVNISTSGGPINLISSDYEQIDGRDTKEGSGQGTRTSSPSGETQRDRAADPQPANAREEITDRSSKEKNVVQRQRTANVVADIQAGSLKAESFDNNKDFLSKMSTINKHSWETSSVKITEDCKHEKLNEPDFQVYPEMRKVKYYYKGGYAQVQPEIRIEEKAEGFLRFFQKPKQKILQNQFIKERGFNVKQHISNGDSLTIESLLKSIMKENTLKTDENLAVTAVVASAGSGKTTLLRRLAGQVMMKNGITDENGFTPSNKSRLNMVRYIELKNVQEDESISVSEFLFGGMFENKKDVEEAYKWLLNNQSKAVVFLDGYDQMKTRIGNKNRVNITPHQKASPATIMYNLLSRSLLSHLQIVISSREFAISELQAESRPQNIVTLTGLSQEDAKKLFISLIGTNGTRAWDKLNTSSRGLRHFISIPVFLILTAMVMSRDSDSPPPDTVTGLFVRLVEILPSTKNIRKRDRIIKIIKKLKKMAHEGMIQGRVTFYEVDLKKHGLSIEDVRDLMMKVPGKNILSRYLLESHHYIFFFFHQSFQEFLSACFITEMNLRDFKNFNRQNLHEDRWSVVRRFSCGLIQDDNLCLKENLHRIPNKETKQKILRKSLPSLLKKAYRYKLLELYAALLESNNYDFINSAVRQIELEDTPLGPDGAHTLSSIMIKSESLNRVDLYRCGINDELLMIMAGNMRGHKVRVEDLTVRIKGFTIAGFNSLLENMIVDTLVTNINHDTDVGSAALDWENIREVILRRKYGDFIMTKTSDFINIHGFRSSLSGTFNMQDKILQIQSTQHHGMVESLLDLEILLKPISATVILAEGTPQQYLEYGDVNTWHLMRNWKFEGKIKKLLLRWSNMSSELDPSLVASIVRILQIEVLDVAVDYEKRDVIPVDRMRDQLSHYGCELNIHWCYLTWRLCSDLTKLTSSLSQNPVDKLRVYIGRERPTEYFETFIKECKVKNLSMLFKQERSESDKEKLMQIAESSDIDLEFGEGFKKMHDTKDAWKECDRDFFR